MTGTDVAREFDLHAGTLHRLAASDWCQERGAGELAEGLRVMAVYEMRPWENVDGEAAAEGVRQFYTWFGPVSALSTDPEPAPATDGGEDTFLPNWWLDAMGRTCPQISYTGDYGTHGDAYAALLDGYAAALAAGTVPGVVRQKAAAVGCGAGMDGECT